MQHTHAVRRLARALAEDAVQEAWLVALRRDLSGPGLRAWLAGTARRIAATQRRAEARRREHEQRAEARAAAPAALETAERLELVKRLVGAVDRLEEPFRTAIVLRYFEDLPPRHVARRIGVPVATARSRARRGIELLRERLGPSGLFALAPLATGPSGIERLAVPALVATAVAGAGAALVLGMPGLIGEPARAPDPGAEPAPAVASAEAPRAAASVSAAARVAAEPGAEPVAPVAPMATRPAEPGAEDAHLAVEPARVEGRLVDASGRPEADRGLVLDMDLVTAAGFALEQREVDRRRAAWVSPATRTDAGGRFALAFEPVHGFGYSLLLHAPTPREWRVLDVEPGERVDLGDLVLGDGATVTGRLVDAAGRVLAQAGWSVTAQAAERSGPIDVGDEGDERIATAELDARAGTYRFDDLRPGRWRLTAAHPLATPVEGPELALATGASATADLAYLGPDVTRTIALTVAWRDAPAPEHVRLIAPDGAERRADEGPPYRFHDVGPGAHALAVDDPRFLPWRREGVQPGTSVRAELEGSAALVLHALDRITRAEIGRFAVRRASAPEHIMGLTALLHDGAAPLPDGRLALVPGAHALVVLAEGYGPERVDVALAPGETRVLELLLGPGASVAGHARFPDGAPADGAEVSVLAPAAEDDGAASRVLRLDSFTTSALPVRRELARTRCDASGAFRFTLERPGPHLVAQLPAEPDAAYPWLRFEAVEDEHVAGLELIVPRPPR